jgi:hypothetical protein
MCIECRFVTSVNSRLTLLDLELILITPLDGMSNRRQPSLPTAGIEAS